MNISKKVWIYLTVIAIICTYFVIRYFYLAHPFTSVNIPIDRTKAINIARNICEKQEIDINNYKSAVSFDVDIESQNYIQLKAGGEEEFIELIEKSFYRPFTWQIRFFNPDNKDDVIIRLTPEGEIYGIKEHNPLKSVGENISSDIALDKGLNQLKTRWNQDVDHYQLLSTDIVDEDNQNFAYLFSLVYKNIRFGDAPLILKLKVQKGLLSEFSYNLDIPEQFNKDFKLISQSNNQIFYPGIILGVLVYVIGGMIFGIIYLKRKKYLLWKNALIFGFGISLMLGIQFLNGFQTIKMSYDFSQEYNTFLFQLSLKVLLRLLLVGTFFSWVFVAAEGLNRKAFPKHTMLWKQFSSKVTATKQFLHHTLFAYLLVPIYFGLYLGLSLFGTYVLGWWIPSEIEPKYLASTFPMFSSIILGFQSGFFEELLSRVIPLAGAVLLAQRFGNYKKWLTLGFVVQVVIFAALHANYPQQPAYARLIVELIIPTIGIGFIYLYFGLYSAILMHTVANIIWSGLPYFIADSPNYYLHTILTIIVALLPIWLFIVSRFRHGSTEYIPEKYLNKSWSRQL